MKTFRFRQIESAPLYEYLCSEEPITPDSLYLDESLTPFIRIQRAYKNITKEGCHRVIQTDNPKYWNLFGVTNIQN